MFQTFYQVSIEGKDLKRFLKKIYKTGIYIEKIDFLNDICYLKLTKDNYLKLMNIKTIYKISIVKLYGFAKIRALIKNYMIFFICLFIGIIFLILMSNTIFDVEILHSKKEIRELVKKELNNYNINKYKFVKSYKEKEKIKNLILSNNKDKLEWIEINRIGVKYEVRVEERIINDNRKDSQLRHVVAKKDSIIMNINASKGEVVKSIGNFVKKGEVIISGFITKNENVKNIVSATGTIYGEVWYKVSINMPYHYKEKIKTGRRKKVLKLSILNKSFYFFNFDKYKDYSEDKIFNLKNNLLPIDFTYSTEYEENNIDEFYTSDEAIIKAGNIVEQKIIKNFKEKEKIISKKIISENINNDSVSLIFFFKVYEDITDIELISNTKVPN